MSLREECGQCGDTKRVNHMGQSAHRCDFKRDSGEVADRLYEVLIENYGYYEECHDTTIALETRDAGTVRFSFGVHFEHVDIRDYSNGEEEEFAVALEAVENLDLADAVVEFKTSYHKRAQLSEVIPQDKGMFKKSTTWITGIEVELE